MNAAVHTVTTVSPTGTGSLARTRRYRAKHRRIDYVPSAAAMAVIDEWLARGLNNCLAGVIDNLLLAGHSAKTDAFAAQGVSGHGPDR